MKFTNVAGLAMLIAFAGCSSKPDPNTFGGRLALEGGEVAAIGEDWNDAQKRIATGEALVEDGKDRIDRGRNQIAKGEKAVDRGQKEVAEGREMIAAGKRASALAEETYRSVIAASATSIAPR